MPFDSATYPETVAQKMLKGFGPNGENWCQGGMYLGEKSCLLGQFILVEKLESGFSKSLHQTLDQSPNFKYLVQACETRTYGASAVIAMNDHPLRSFDEIRAVLQKMHELEMQALVECKMEIGKPVKRITVIPIKEPVRGPEPVPMKPVPSPKTPVKQPEPV